MVKTLCSVRLFAISSLILVVPLWCQAQDTPPVPPPAPEGTNRRSTPRRSLQTIANQLIQATGAKILVVSDIAQEIVAMPEQSASADNLEETLDQLVRRIPQGVWAKVYLPPLANRRYTGDTVAQFAAAEAALFGRQPKPEPGTVTLLGKRMTAAEAAPYLNGLGLEPYYVLFSRRAMATQTSIGAPGRQGKDPISEALLKQLGVANIRDIPSGDYEVMFTDANGIARKAQVKVTNEGGRTSLRVSITENGN